MSKIDLEHLINEELISDEKIGKVVSSINPNYYTQYDEFYIRIHNNSKTNLQVGELIGIPDINRQAVIYSIIDQLYSYERVSSIDHKYDEEKISNILQAKNIIDNPIIVLAKVRFIRRFSYDILFNDSLLDITPNLPVYRVKSKGILNAYKIKGNIPIGLFAISLNNYLENSVIKLDEYYLLGKEAAHFNVSGMSGFGKTSLALFVLKSILTHSERKDNIRIVMFNVKEDDLLWVDKPNQELDDEDLKIYQSLEIPPEPFENVVYYTTNKGANTSELASLRTEDMNCFNWEWEDVKSYIKYAIGPLEKWDDKMDLCLSRIFDYQYEHPSRDGYYSFNDVIRYIDQRLTSNNQFSGIRKATWGKFKRIISGIYEKNGGLLRRGRHPIPYEEVFKENEILIIDINETYFRDYTQKLIFTKIITDLQQLIEENALNISNLIILTDELSKYGPTQISSDKGNLIQVRNKIIDISERGRSIGVTLFGLEQFMSKVSPDIIGNISTYFFNKTRSKELTNSLYTHYPNYVNYRMPNLPKGYSFVDNTLLSQILMIRYPRPPCSQKRLSLENKSKKSKKKVSSLNISPINNKQQILDDLINDDNENG
ncbi:MAG: hypothetical protein GF317_06105 [Candidatus Lokiarchaeota archaeon]|nr:hypothetical protein [Candidatus Lokiarchaeota archaeon]